MQIYIGLFYLLFFSLIGEVISKFFNIPFPGSVIGMVLLFICLQFKFVKLSRVEKVSEFFINNLGILFVPAGVGIMTKFSLIKNIWFSFFVLAILSTIISLVVSVKVVEFVKKKYEADIDD